jgi:Nucleotidyl transferase AbiEii toxin, Type IV TA system
MSRREGCSMPDRFEPRIGVLPAAQREIWPSLASAPDESFVLYRGTAVALHLGHRVSIDFDFFRSAPLDKEAIEGAFPFMRNTQTIQEGENTLVVSAMMPSGSVKVSFFGGLSIGRINDPLRTADAILLVASMEDLLATKLKAILDRAESKDYRDISAMLSADVSLEKALGAFAKMYRRDPGLPLKAMGFFKDGDLPSLPESDRKILRLARDRISEIPDVTIQSGLCGT